jgi:asparagine synthase (glutamine-hydrolysing)
MDIGEARSRLRILLDEAVKGEKAEGVLLSGGLDTSVIALIASRHVKDLKAFTVTLKGCDEDLKYAKKVARFLNLDHKIHYFSEQQLVEAASEAVGIVAKSEYESGVPPHIKEGLIEGYTEVVGPTTLAPLYIAMRFARSYVESVYVGDGADELFLGYNSIVSFIDFIGSNSDEPFGAGFVADFERELSSRVFQAYDLRYPYMLAKSLDLEVKAPYLTLEVSEFARKLSVEHKVRSEGGKIWGKWILRKAFEEYLPKDIVWREKTTIDRGTGSITPLILR